MATSRSEYQSDTPGGMNSRYPGPLPGSVDLIWVSIDALDDDDEQVLSPAERERAHNFVGPHDQARFIVGAATLRRVLASVLGQDPRAVPLRRDCPDCERAHGRPQLDSTANAGELDFSLAHSGSWVLIGLVRGSRVGVDIEQMRELSDLRSLASRVLTEDERADVGSDPESFFAYWVAKESAVKATGQGLRTPLREVRSIAPQTDAGVTLLPAGQPAWTQRLRAPAGYLAAVTTLGTDQPTLRTVPPP